MLEARRYPILPSCRPSDTVADDPFIKVPDIVADAVRDHFRESCAQLYAGYPLSSKSTQKVEEAHEVAKYMVNAHDVGEVQAIISLVLARLCVLSLIASQPSLFMPYCRLSLGQALQIYSLHWQIATAR